MKNNTAFHPRSLVLALFTPMLAIAALFAAPATARAAVVYVGQDGNGTQGTGSIGEYNATTGAGGTIITGLNSPAGLALSGNTLFVSNALNGTVGTYNATTGAPINSSFITGLGSAFGLALSGNTLFVANSGTVGKYDATTGVGGAFITGLSGPMGLALSGNNLFVAYSGTVGKYDATTGAGGAFITGLSFPVDLAVSGSNLYVALVENPSIPNSGTVGKYDTTTGAGGAFIIGLGSPRGLALSLNDLYVAEVNSNTVGEYDATTGTTINGSFITGLSEPVALTVAPLPEPTTLVLAAIGALALLGRNTRRQGRGQWCNASA